jgi:hypothetical protein
MVISHYRLIQVLGHTGTMVICKAEDLNTGRLVAVKFRSTRITLGEAPVRHPECYLDHIAELQEPFARAWPRRAAIVRVQSEPQKPLPEVLPEIKPEVRPEVQQEVTPEVPSEVPPRRRHWLFIALSVLLLALLALMFFFTLHHSP